MATDLPTNVDQAYEDSPTDPSVRTHQRHHDEIHRELNDATAKGSIAEQFAATAPRTALYLPGVASSYPSAPGSVTVSGDFDLRIRVDMPTTGSQALIWKRLDSTQGDYTFRIKTAADVAVGYEQPGGGYAEVTLTVAGGVPTGQPVWWRAALDVDDGAGNHVVTVYRSLDDTDDADSVTWEQVASSTVAGVVVPLQTTAPLAVGVQAFAGNIPLTGRVHRAQVRDGIDGPVLADLRTDAPMGPRYRDPAGVVWTLNGDAWSWMVA